MTAACVGSNPISHPNPIRRGSSEEEHAPDKREVEISKLSPDTTFAHVAQLVEQPLCKRPVERSMRSVGTTFGCIAQW